ncbi:phytoene desaturase family protein [Clostridium sp.]|uniref:phytoene desaturase family protein n=1 Tax=Clostridium sp. TaxID=1506 RepID=UPI002637D39A
MNSKKKAIIVGAGIGGLATAIRLLINNFEVDIFEKNSKIGGKVNLIEYKDFKIDSSASIFMLPKPYLEIFKYTKKDYKNYIELIELNTLYKVFNDTGDSFNIYSDFLRTTESLEKIFNDESSNYYKYISNSYRRYLLVEKYFLNRSFFTLNYWQYFKSLPELLRIHPFKNCYKTIEKYINNEYLKNLLAFQCMYIGESPLKSSNVFNLIPSTTQIYGLYYIKGGMYSYVKALEKLILELGGKIHLNSNVRNILMKKNVAIGVNVNHENIFSDLIVCNSDFTYTIQNLIPRSALKNKISKRKQNNLLFSCSTFILHLFLKKKYENLNIHNILLNLNKEEVFLAPFIGGNLPKEYIYYIYCPSSIDPSLVPKNCECLNIILRVPNLKKYKSNWSESTVISLRNKVLCDISKIKGLEDIEENILYESYTTPITLKNDFNCFFGAAFGLNHNLLQTTFFRPQAKIKSLQNIYFVGDSVHPGSGISMSLISAKLCSEKIISDFK